MAGGIIFTELDILGDQFALLPGDGVTGLVASPHLVAVLVRLPVGEHAVGLGHVHALGHQLPVGDVPLGLHAALLREPARHQGALLDLLLPHSELALSEGDNLNKSINNDLLGILA